MSTASSPCIGVCTIDEGLALCLGCGRTIDEIVAWGALDEAARRAVMAELPARLAARAPAGPADGPMAGSVVGPEDGGAPALDAGAGPPQLS